MAKDTTKPLVVSIDDEKNILKLIQHMLEPYYIVVTFSDTEQALLTLPVLRPDLIICDINMPGLSGFELHTQLRDSDSLRSVPFIYLTALGDRQTFRRGMLQGADDFLIKPFTAEELREAVRARLERTQGLREEMKSTWLVSSLGGACIESDNKVREYENKKVLELFLYLVSKARAVPQAQLVRDLWWEPIEANTLHVLLNRARKTFEGLAEFPFEEDYVGVKVLRPYSWDAATFEEEVKRALTDKSEVIVEKAVQRFKGSFLADFSSPWSDERRDYYEELYIRVLELSIETAQSKAGRKHAQQRFNSYLNKPLPD